ncbi:MAG: hypothetical protein FRX49_07329 [Trebouxia sp. A1-2]|nr:MAG: hypothetical protein FRX49_07329 [Trebouxia sp. A1-2]
MGLPGGLGTAPAIMLLEAWSAPNPMKCFPPRLGPASATEGICGIAAGCNPESGRSSGPGLLKTLGREATT